MGHNSSKRKGKRKATSADADDSEGPVPADKKTVFYLPEILDGMPLDGVASEEKAHLFWNSVLIEGPAEGSGAYVETFPQYPYRKASPERDFARAETNESKDAEVDGHKQRVSRKRVQFEPSSQECTENRRYADVRSIKKTKQGLRSPTPWLKRASQAPPLLPLLVPPQIFESSDDVDGAPRGVMRGGFGGSEEDSLFGPPTPPQGHHDRQPNSKYSITTSPHMQQAPTHEERNSPSEEINHFYHAVFTLGDNPVAPSPPAGMAWSWVLSQVRASPEVDLSLVSRIEDHHLSPDSPVTLQTANLVPNFSRPIFANTFHRRHSSPPPNTGDTSDTLFSGETMIGSADEIDFGLPNAEAHPFPPCPHARPTTSASADDYPRLLPPSKPDTPIPLEEKVRLYKGTIGYQISLIKNLHEEVDRMREELKQLYHSSIPFLLEAIQERENAIRWYRTHKTEIEEENSVLDDALEACIGMLRGCSDREAAMVRWLKTLKYYLSYSTNSGVAGFFRRLLKRGDVWDVAELQRLPGIPSLYGWKLSGEPRNVAGLDITKPLSLRQLDDIIEVAEQNVRILGKDLEDLQGVGDGGSESYYDVSMEGSTITLPAAEGQAHYRS